MTCLSIVQNACISVGVPSPLSVATTSDATAVKMLGLLNRVGSEVSRQFDWQALTKQASFTTNGASEYTISASPVSITDMAYLTTPYLYDRTDNNAIIAIGANEYQLRKMYGLSSIAHYRYRIVGNKIQFDDAVPTGHVIHFEYKTKNWVIPASGSDKAAFTLDDDTSYLDEELLTLGLIAKYKNASSMTYDEEYKDYQEYLETLKNNDKPQRLISLARTSVRDQNFPDTYEADL